MSDLSLNRQIRIEVIGLDDLKAMNTALARLSTRSMSAADALETISRSGLNAAASFELLATAMRGTDAPALRASAATRGTATAADKATAAQVDLQRSIARTLGSYTSYTLATKDASKAADVTAESLGGLSGEQLAATRTALDLSTAQARLATAVGRVASQSDASAVSTARLTAEQRRLKTAIIEANAQADIAARNPLSALYAEASGANLRDKIARDYPGIEAEQRNTLLAARMRARQSEAGRTIRNAAFGAAGNLAAGIDIVGGASVMNAMKIQAAFRAAAANSIMSQSQEAEMERAVLSEAKRTGAGIEDLARAYEHINNYAFRGAAATKILVAANEAARATFTATAPVAQMTAKVMNVYGISADRAAEVTNKLYLAAGESDQRFAEMVDNQGRAVTMGRQLGQTLDTMAASLSALTQKGLDSSQAAHGLENAMARTARPTKQMELILQSTQERLRKMGNAAGVDLVHDFTLAGLKTRQFGGVLQDLQTAADELHVPVSTLVVELFPRLRALMAYLVGTGPGGIGGVNDRLRQMADITNGARPVTQHFAEAQASLQQQMEKLTETIRADFLPVGLEFGKEVRNLVPVVKDAAEAILEIMRVFESLPGPVKEAIIVFGGLRLASLALGSPLGGLRDLIAAVITRFSAVPAAAAGAEGAIAAEGVAADGAATATTAFGVAMTGILGPANLVIAALGSIALAYHQISDAIADVNRQTAGAYANEGRNLLTQTPIQHALALRTNLRMLLQVGQSANQDQLGYWMTPDQRAQQGLPTPTDHVYLSDVRRSPAFQNAGRADLEAIMSFLPRHHDAQGDYVLPSDIRAALGNQQKIIDAYGRSSAARRAGTMSPTQIFGLLRQTGFTSRQAVIMGAIALAESGGNTSEISRPNFDGSVDRGLFQINSRAWADVPNSVALNPEAAARVAYDRISRHGTNFGAWTGTYPNGKYLQFIPQMLAAAKLNPMLADQLSASDLGQGNDEIAAIMGGHRARGTRARRAGQAAGVVDAALYQIADLEREAAAEAKLHKLVAGELHTLMRAERVLAEESAADARARERVRVAAARRASESAAHDRHIQDEMDRRMALTTPDEAVRRAGMTGRTSDDMDRQAIAGAAKALKLLGQMADEAARKQQSAIHKRAGAILSGMEKDQQDAIQTAQQRAQDLMGIVMPVVATFFASGRLDRTIGQVALGYVQQLEQQAVQRLLSPKINPVDKNTMALEAQTRATQELTSSITGRGAGTASYTSDSLTGGIQTIAGAITSSDSSGGGGLTVNDLTGQIVSGGGGGAGGGGAAGMGGKGLLQYTAAANKLFGGAGGGGSVAGYPKILNYAAQGYQGLMTGVGIFEQGQQQGVTVGGVLGGAAAGAEFGSAFGPEGTAIGAGVGGFLDILGGLFHHSKPVDTQRATNPALYNAPSDFDYYAYRYRATAQLPTAQQLGVPIGHVPAGVINVALNIDGVQHQLSAAVTNQTALGTVSLQNAGFDLHRPV